MGAAERSDEVELGAADSSRGAVEQSAASRERAAGAKAQRRRDARARREAPPPRRDPGGVGERPRAPWHPVPVDELLILIGLIAVVIGASQGEGGLPELFAGIGAVVIGTLEFSAREHLSGYRSHTSLLAAVPTALFHGGLALALNAFGVSSTALILVPLALDVPLFALLFKLLKSRFDDARRERVFALRR